jgi:hypothetical protein
MDAWEALLLERKEDDGLPCYHLMEKYSTDVLDAVEHFVRGTRQGLLGLALGTAALGVIIGVGALLWWLVSWLVRRFF